MKPERVSVNFTVVKPNLQNCQEGILDNPEAEKVLNRLNYIRSLHSLSPVNYNYRDDTYTAKYALIIAANADRDEIPNSTFKCWSEPGPIGRKNSSAYTIIYPPGDNQISPGMNLYKSENFVDALLMDSRRENISTSNWLLNPFLKSISFGRVDGKPLAAKAVVAGWDGQHLESQADYISGATIKFTYDEKPNISNLNTNAIAYPSGEYPQELFKKDAYQRGYPTMFLSVVAAHEKLIGEQNVDFSNAIIEISGEDGNKLQINTVQYKNNRTSLPNTLTWKVNQIKSGVKYNVKIKNVKVFDTINDYKYWFKLK